MDEKDRNSNGLQSPVLSPESVALKKKETPGVPETVASKEPQKSSSNRGKAILIRKARKRNDQASLVKQ